MRPDWHETWQLPPLQTCPAAQAVPAVPLSWPQLPAAPQFVRLVMGSMQLWPHWTIPGGHAIWHTPRAQTLPAVQALPQVPQF
jgi:hypothetical protein